MWTHDPSNRRATDRFPAISFLSAIGALMALIALFFQPIREQLDGIEHWTSDWRTVLLADRIPEVHDKIAVVVFNSETFGGATVSPIPRDVHADVIRTLDAMVPRAIGTDFYFVHGQGEEKDQAFLFAVRSSHAPLVLGAVDGRTGEFSDGQLAYQEGFLRRAERPAGYLQLKYDSGNVVRSMSEPKEGSPFTESFAFSLAKAAGMQIAGVPKTGRIAWLAGPDSTVQPFVTIPAQDVLSAKDEKQRRAIAEMVRGRVIITGIDMPNQDRHNTALSVRDGERMLGVMIHTHMLAQILDGRHYRELRGLERFSLLAAVGVAGFGLSWLFRQRRFDFLSLSVATAVLVGIDALNYSIARTVLPFTLTLSVWFLAVTAGHNLRTFAAWSRRRRRRV